ncbi:MAG TPA: GAF domain-containing protein [Aggregatilineales bacterium]|nr:GAF domain-containing protein [Aggregatilineales bacterium]HPV06847.1 GAF domain-containing protein [Aggregatilineales bacterium]HQA68722.1 GAF domain-containing protein [Aggregatilineales bacterium]HQE19274.1 GAF domain-containing protein [Aggregatilineales bacterium]
MTTTHSRPRRIDPRSLPIALKLAIGLGGVLLVTMFVTIGLVNDVVRTSQTDLVLDELAALSADQAGRVVQTLDAEIEGLSRLVSDPSVQQYIREASSSIAVSGGGGTFRPSTAIESLIAEYRITHPELSALAVLDAAGYVIGAAPMLPAADLPERGSWEWFQVAQQPGGMAVYLSGPIADGLTGVEGFHIAMPIVDTTVPGRVVGVVYAVWNMSNVPPAAQARSREALIVQSDGEVLYASDPGAESRLPYALVRTLREAGEPTLEYEDAHGERWLYGVASLGELSLRGRDASLPDLTVVVREPYSVMQTSAVALMQNLLWALALSALLVTVLAGGMTLVLLYPLRRLTIAAGRISAGQLETPIPDLPLDEVGRLASVLRDLVGRLLVRMQQLDAAVQVSRVALRSLDVNELLESTSRTLVSAFGVEGVRVYFADQTRGRAELVAGHGAIYETLLRQEPALAIDERTHVGRAILLGEPQVAAAPGYHLAEAALPLVAGESVTGVLCVTGRHGARFAVDDLDMFSLVADQLSAALQNARLFAASAENMEQISALNRRLMRRGWEEYLELAGELRSTTDPAGDWPTLPSELWQRTEAAAEVTVDEQGREVLSAPLIVRGEVIGVVAATRPPGQGWSEQERLLVEAVAARLATLADSIRMVEETSWRAEQERRVNELSASLQSAISLDDMLRDALARLGEATGAESVALRVGRPPADGQEAFARAAQTNGGRPGAAHTGPNGAGEG